MTIPIGRMLNQRLVIGAKHALYREDGRWYEHAYESLRHGKKLNVTGGISDIPGYLHDRRIAAILRSDSV